MIALIEKGRGRCSRVCVPVCTGIGSSVMSSNDIYQEKIIITMAVHNCNNFSCKHCILDKYLTCSHITMCVFVLSLESCCLSFLLSHLTDGCRWERVKGDSNWSANRRFH